MKTEISKNVSRVSKISLSERQSVRTTFNLSEDSINAIDWLLKTNNLKPKELFDLLCTNDGLIILAVEAAANNANNLELNQTRKTFVISKQALRLLNKQAKDKNLSRDLVVDKLVSLFKFLLENHSKSEKQKEEKASLIIDDFWRKAEEVEHQLKELLDDDNPILERFRIIIVVIMHLSQDIESKLKKDEPIDPENF